MLPQSDRARGRARQCGTRRTVRGERTGARAGAMVCAGPSLHPDGWRQGTRRHDVYQAVTASCTDPVRSALRRARRLQGSKAAVPLSADGAGSL